MTHTRGLITQLISIHEPPSKGTIKRGFHPVRNSGLEKGTLNEGPRPPDTGLVFRVLVSRASVYGLG